ncbi:MAG: MBL fold metallo-hydrolase [Streptosporangiales bacterium]|nr:MBL fold metallo-hydrolase [Streptosporangiales bacterium]
MTLDGTNTWVLAEPDARRVAVVDPGPLDEGHLQRILQVVAAGGGRVGLVLLTHGHSDHAEGARRFAELTDSPVRALDPAHRLGEEGFAEGDVVELDGLEVRVLETPGHSGDSLCFLLPGDDAVLTGDTVLGRGTTVIARDGRLGDYLASLRRLRALAASTQARVLLPGHGPTLTDPLGVVEYYLAHRRERLDQVEAALAAGDRTPREIVHRVYGDVDPVLWPAAEWSVRAQLDYLAERGALRSDDPR